MDVMQAYNEYAELINKSNLLPIIVIIAGSIALFVIMGIQFRMESKGEGTLGTMIAMMALLPLTILCSIFSPSLIHQDIVSASDRVSDSALRNIQENYNIAEAKVSSEDEKTVFSGEKIPLWASFDPKENRNSIDKMNYIDIKSGEVIYRYYLEINQDGDLTLIKDASSTAPDPEELRK